MFRPKTVFHVGDKVWTFHNARPTVIGPLTIREVLDDTGFYVCSDNEVTMKVGTLSVAATRHKAAQMAKAWYKCKIEVSESLLEEAKEALKIFCDKEGVN